MSSCSSSSSPSSSSSAARPVGSRRRDPRAPARSWARFNALVAIAFWAWVTVSCTGCAAFRSALEAVSEVSRASQWVASVVDVAEDGSRAYFARHPSPERQGDVSVAVEAARRSLAILNGLLAGADAVDRGDVQEARRRALEAYAALYDMLEAYGINGALPPAGGAETEERPPDPLHLPTPEMVAARI